MNVIKNKKFSIKKCALHSSGIIMGKSTSLIGKDILSGCIVFER